MSASPESPDAPPRISGMRALAQRYSGFVLDQWGVLHDGTQPYAGAVECLQRLREAGKRVVVLSNSSKREAESLRILARMGFDPRCIDRFISAGEDARAALESRRAEFHRGLGTRCYAFTRGGDRSLFEGIGLTFVDRVDDAEFVAVIGSDAPRRRLADYEPALRAGVERDLPMICANPDTARLTPQGIVEGQGLLAEHYEALGGRVHYHGKPYPAIYNACLEALGCAPERVITVGDSVEHDVLGAARARLASALIPGGVHADALGIRWGELPQPHVWAAFAANAPARPDYLLDAFNW